MEIKKIGNYSNIQGITNIKAEKISRKGEKKKNTVEFKGASEIKKLLNSAKEISEVREKLVNELKTAIENGTFKIDYEKIAKSILGG